MASTVTEVPDIEPRNITARVLAPLALIACGLVLFLLVSGTLSNNDDGSAGDQREPRREQARDKPVIEGDTYVVVPGDTFSGIAANAGISLRRLERLNPGLDPATLNAGQQIKLR